MFGIFKSRHYGRHKHPKRQLKNHRGTGGQGLGRHHGHGRCRKHAHWQKSGTEVRPLYDISGLSAGLPPAKRPSDETNPVAAAATCPLCENHCLLSDPGCGKGEAYALSLNAA